MLTCFPWNSVKKIKRFRCQVEIRGRKWISKQEAERGRLQFNLWVEKSIDSYWPVTCQLFSVLQNCQGSVPFSAHFSKAFKRKIMQESLIGWGEKKKKRQASSPNMCLPLFRWAVLHMPVIQLPGNRLCWATAGHQHIHCQRWVQIEGSNSKLVRWVSVVLCLQ